MPERRRKKHRRDDLNSATPWAFRPPPMLVPRPVADAQCLQDKNASVAKVTVHKVSMNWGDDLPAEEYSFEATGSAKREQGDRYDPVTGELLALARAYQRLSRQLQAEASKRVTVLVKEQEEAEQAKLMKRLTGPKAVRRRTKEEWEAMQHGRGAEATGIAMPDVERSSTEEIPLASGETMVIENTAVVFKDPEGRARRRIERA